MPPAESSDSNSRPLSDIFGVIFAPEKWSSARCFRFFVGPPFPSNHMLLKATSAVENRRQKLQLLGALADDLRQGLIDDFRELESTGYTSASRSKTFTAVVETIFLELYSTLDAVRSTLFEAYRGVRGIQNKRTSQLFRRAHEGTYGPDFPEPIRARLAEAYVRWFPQLRDIRGEVSHGDIGQCYISSEAGSITYIHGGLGTSQRPLVIKGLESTLMDLSSNVDQLVDDIFGYLCSQLDPRPVRVTCGIYRGRIYERTVEYKARMSFDTGECFSRRWFEAEEELKCPMRERCGAYRR